MGRLPQIGHDMDRRLRKSDLTPVDTPPSGVVGSRLQRQAKILKAVLVSTVLFLLFSVGFSIHVVRTAQTKGPQIIAEMTESRVLEAERRLDARLEEARDLTTQFYQFLAVLLESNPPVRSIRNHWNTISFQTASLALDLSSLPQEPLRATTRLYETGPSRVESILLSARQITHEMQALVPRLVKALRQARNAMSEDGGMIAVILGSLDELIMPFVQDDTTLNSEWSRMKSQIQEWVERVANDVVFVQQSVVAEALSEEFAQRLWGELF